MKSKYASEQLIEITIFKPREGKFPIGRSDSGMICRIQTDNKKAYYEYGSVWTATVIEVKDRSLVVTPFALIRSAEQEKSLVAERLKSVVVTKQQRKRKDKVNYQYQSKNEILKTKFS